MGNRWEKALITGASAGIGEAFARALATRGSNLVLVARRAERLDRLAAELGRPRIEVETLAADLTDRAQIARVEERLSRGDIDLLVNNAGGGEPGRGAFADHDRDALEGQAVLNALSVLRLTHAAVAAMKTSGRGDIIQVSAGIAFYPVPYGAVYSASKAFVNRLSEAVDRELRGSGVHITVTCPGFTRTEAPGRIGFDESNVPRPLWTDPETVVEDALKAASKGRTITNPTFVNKVGAAFGAHFPRTMMRWATSLAAKQ